MPFIKGLLPENCVPEHCLQMKLDQKHFHFIGPYPRIGPTNPFCNHTRVLYKLVSIAHKPHKESERASQTLIINLNNPQSFYYPFWVLTSDLRNKTNSHYRMLQTTNHITETAASLNPMVTPTEWTKLLTTNFWRLASDLIITVSDKTTGPFNKTWICLPFLCLEVHG